MLLYMEGQGNPKNPTAVDNRAQYSVFDLVNMTVDMPSSSIWGLASHSVPVVGCGCDSEAAAHVAGTNAEGVPL